jgi:hypothetical protein
MRKEDMDNTAKINDPSLEPEYLLRSYSGERKKRKADHLT